MVEVEEIPDELYAGAPVKAKGFCVNRNPEENYDETVFAIQIPEGIIQIGTKNSLNPKESQRWVVGLNKEHVRAFARHLLNLARDMD